MKMHSMKKFFLFAILLMAMNLVACGGSSTSSGEDENECRKDPLSCSTAPQEENVPSVE